MVLSNTMYKFITCKCTVHTQTESILLMWYIGKKQSQKVRWQDSRAERNFKYKNTHHLKSMSYIKLLSIPLLAIDKAVDLPQILTLSNKDYSWYLSDKYE